MMHLCYKQILLMLMKLIRSRVILSQGQQMDWFADSAGADGFDNHSRDKKMYGETEIILGQETVPRYD